MNKNIIVIGIGNPERGDDAAGCCALKYLSTDNKLSDSCQFIEHSGEALALIEAWQDYRYAILIDAVRADLECGSIIKLNLIDEKLPEDIKISSSHLLGVYEAVELARTLKKLPDELIFFGIQGDNFTLGTKPAQVITDNLPKLRNMINELILANGNLR